MSATKKHPFSVYEDLQIINHIKMYGPNNWNIIAGRLSRTPKQCRERWNGHLNPSINKGPWTYYEDCILVEKQRVLGNKWAEIARFLPGRTDTIVKNRWHTSLKNRLSEFQAKPVQTSQMSNDITQWLKQFQRERYELPPIISQPTALPPLVQHH